MTQVKQAGSMASFIIIGGVLVLVTAGALFWAARQHDANDIDTGTNTPEVSLPSATDGDKSTTSDTDKNAGSDKKKTDSGNESSQAPGKKSTTAKKDNANSADSGSSAKSARKSVDELSHTGPADTLAQILAVGLLTASTLAFVRSRRTKTSL